MRRALAVIALLACLGPARAHEELALHSLTVVGSVPAALEGVEVRVAHLGAPALVVDNPTDTTVRVLDENGRPFLEIGPRGVRGDVSSKLFYESILPGTHDRLQPRGKEGVTWVTFSRAPRWTWFDPRLAWTGEGTAWEVPLTYGDVATPLSGGFEPLDHHGHFTSEIDLPAVEGLDLRLAQGPVPVLYARNDTGEPLEIFGTDGEPFLRLGPKGTFANLMSPTYYSAGALTIKRVPSWADATAPPRWKRLSPQPVWAWLEYRAALSADMQARDRLGSRPSTVHSWTSPMTLGGRDLDVQGRVEWVPPGIETHDDARSGNLVPKVAMYSAAIIAIAAAIVLLKRPRTRAA